MSQPKILRPRLAPPRPFTEPSPSLLITLDDGVERKLCYTLRSYALMDERKLRRGLRSLGAEIPELIWIGLHAPDGTPPEGITLEQIQALGADWYPYLVDCWRLAHEDAVGSQEKKLAELVKQTQA